MNFLLFQIPDGILEFFVGDPDVSGWEDAASQWIITALVLGVLGAGLVFGIKALKKSRAGLVKQKIWTRRESWLLVFAGLFPVFIGLLIVWYLSSDFFDIVMGSGLMAGTLFAWLIYLALMVIGHLASPWRRELV